MYRRVVVAVWHAVAQDAHVVDMNVGRVGTKSFSYLSFFLLLIEI